MNKFIRFVVVIMTMFCSILMAEKSVDNLKQLPTSIDQVAKKIPVNYICCHDPNYLILDYIDVKKSVETVYDVEKHFDAVFKWEEEQKKNGRKRPMHLCYTFDKGVELVDELSKRRILLPGFLEYHPIDLATSMLERKFYSTYDMMNIQKLARKAWDRELNRIYQHLGGAKNIPLRDMQRQWIKFRDAQINFISQYYSKKQGTI